MSENPIDPRIPQFDPVNKPKHYIAGRRYEPLDVIKDWHLDYHLGCALKYISRAGRKGDFNQDVEKAIFYLQDRLKHQDVLNRTVKTAANLEERWPELRYIENEPKGGVCPICRIHHIEKPCPKKDLTELRGGQ